MVLYHYLYVMYCYLPFKTATQSFNIYLSIYPSPTILFTLLPILILPSNPCRPRLPSHAPRQVVTPVLSLISSRLVSALSASLFFPSGPCSVSLCLFFTVTCSLFAYQYSYCKSAEYSSLCVIFTSLFPLVLFFAFKFNWFTLVLVHYSHGYVQTLFMMSCFFSGLIAVLFI